MVAYRHLTIQCSRPLKRRLIEALAELIIFGDEMYKSLLVLVLAFGINISAMAEVEVKESEGLSKAQWWVLGTTGGLLVGSLLFTHQTHSQEPRKAIAAVGLVTFVGVSLYEDKKKKAKLGFVEGRPSLLLTASF